MGREVKIAIIQETAPYLDMEASLLSAVELIKESASDGAQLVVFGESWLTGYPVWLDHAANYAKWDDPTTRKLYQRIHESSVKIDSEAMDTIRQTSFENEVCVCIGLNELDSATSGTIFNSVVIIDQGELIFHHRKLMPTYTEKLIYGAGDGRGMISVDSSVGRIGALICWEHWMPLARQAMHDSGEEIHIALWPQVHEMLQVASRHYAFEGRVFVVAAGQVTTKRNMPEEIHFDADVPDYLLTGQSAVIDPRGNYLLEPQNKDVRIAWCTIPDISIRYSEKMTLDVSGHYARPDIFDFKVNPFRG